MRRFFSRAAQLRYAHSAILFRAQRNDVTAPDSAAILCALMILRVTAVILRATAADSTDDSRALFPIHPEMLSIKNAARPNFSHQNRTQKNRFKNRNKKLFAQTFFIAKKHPRQIII
ncbi:MAG: hypothetical protein Q8K65_02925 [Alphaproteobacteria bacterium]|nr:hypothetical protein [Alphaproteobacteria bacterium]